jgi:hypothetical protein
LSASLPPAGIVPVAIVGAGPGGLVLARRLRRLGGLPAARSPQRGGELARDAARAAPGQPLVEPTCSI